MSKVFWVFRLLTFVTEQHINHLSWDAIESQNSGTELGCIANSHTNSYVTVAATLARYSKRRFGIEWLRMIDLIFSADFR